MMPGEEVDRRVLNNAIEIAPLAFMRGRTLNKSFIILDEAQNTLPTQMKMFLTRLGQDSKMVITGDLSQKDLPDNAKSGMMDAMEKLEKVKDIGFVHLNSSDVCRHGLVEKIINAYDK
jgi:phosphate starvation-inducible PhoH-like protein